MITEKEMGKVLDEAYRNGFVPKKGVKDKDILPLLWKIFDENKRATKKIFFDLDESLIFAHLEPFPEDDDVENHELSVKGKKYYIAVHSSAREMVFYARIIFGDDNVYILCGGSVQYARLVNETVGFEFKNSHILGHSDLLDHQIATSSYAPVEFRVCEKFRETDNFLIDNMDPKFNIEKTSFLGIRDKLKTNYLKVKDYVGVEHSYRDIEVVYSALNRFNSGK